MVDTHHHPPVYELKGVGLDGKEKLFQKPWAMTTTMFVGAWRGEIRRTARSPGTAVADVLASTGQQLHQQQPMWQSAAGQVQLSVRRRAHAPSTLAALAVSVRRCATPQHAQA
jgi:hypothetical protein